MISSDSRYLFIVNPIAGGSSKDACMDFLKRAFEKRDIPFHIFETTGKNDFEEAQKAIDKVDPNTVVAVGGDGTINLVAQLLRDTDLRFGIIPVGSANGMAVELGIPQDFENATRVLLYGSTRSLDAILINQTYLSIHLSDIGLNAKVVKRFEEEKLRGMGSYIRQFISELFHLRPSKFTLILDGRKPFRKKANMIVLANATKYGTGIAVNPDGKLDDGYFEICVIKPFLWYQFFPILFSFLAGRVRNSPHVNIYQCQSAQIINRDEEVLQIDGEVIGNPKTVDAQILPQAYQVIVPTP